jgi:hypothetical protein
MKNVIFILLVIFTFCSCASEDAGFERLSKKEIMDSWAWKIFIFTDLGETTPVEPVINNFDDTIKVKPIFVEDAFSNFNADNIFFTKQKIAFSDPIEGEKLIVFKRKK